MLGVNVEGMRKTWLEGTGPSLRRRRAVAALSAIGLADFSVISLYQLGVFKKMPDPPGRIFDSNKINASKKAYKTGMPDGPLGALFYAGIMAIAAFGGNRGSGRPKGFAWLQAAVATSGAFSALDYLREMIFVEKKACPWCVVGAGLNLAIMGLAAQDLVQSVREG